MLDFICLLVKILHKIIIKTLSLFALIVAGAPWWLMLGLVLDSYMENWRAEK